MKDTKFEITKREAIALFGSQTKLAKALGLSDASVSAWPMDEPIPKLRAMEIRYEIIGRPLSTTES